SRPRARRGLLARTRRDPALLARAPGRRLVLRVHAAGARHHGRARAGHHDAGRRVPGLARGAHERRRRDASRGDVSAPATGVEARAVTKTYPMPAGPVEALRGIDLAVPRGDYLALMGPSGCGKSTLLHLLGAVDLPTGGSVAFEGRDLARLDD